MSALRGLRLSDAGREVARVAAFRAPQAASFDRLRELVEQRLPDDLDLVDASQVAEAVRTMGLPVRHDYAELIFALATGVGKRRLLGACAAYLYAARQTRNVLIIAPRAAILDRLEREALASSTAERLFQPGADDYLFLDHRLVPSPNVCTRETLESFQPDRDRLNVFILSPQTLTGENRRIARPRPYASVPSLLDYLRESGDLVVLADEAHHIGDEVARWRRAIDDLAPKLYLGFTATPEQGAPIAHSYDLATCLREGLYTKAVEIYTRQRDPLLEDDQWEAVTIDYAMRRLERKRAALEALAAEREDWTMTEPVLLLTCRDTDHAELVGRFLAERYELQPGTDVIVTHSARTPSEQELQRLAGLDAPGNKVRVVVQVQQLTEGWDVRRVYVMAPLRTMGTFQYAVQNLGRGLRLPLARRVGDPDADTLDVVLFGRETAREIIDRARGEFGDPDLGSSPIGVTAAEDDDVTAPPPKTRIVQRAAQRIEWEWPRLRRMPPPVDLDFDPDVDGRVAEAIVTRVSLGPARPGGAAAEEAPAYDLATLKRVTVAHVCEQLEFLDEATDRPGLEGLIDRALAKLGMSGDQEAVYVSPLHLSAHLADLLRRRRSAAETTLEPTGASDGLVLDELPLLVPEGVEPLDYREVGG